MYVTVPAAEAQAVVDTASADDGVADARIVAEPAASGRTVVRVTPTTEIDEEATMELVGRLRPAIHETSAEALVGGPAATNYDLTHLLTSRAPVAIALIMIVAFVLLLVVFRSLTIAISSIVLNLISVAASFGFATLVFQHGFGAGIIGIEHQGFVDAWAPLFFFALLFGLSMDYQLFLLAAIRERYEATGDTQTAIREGIARTGRPITNAALIMIVVFIAFGITGPIPTDGVGHHPCGGSGARRHGGADDARAVADGPARGAELVASRLARAPAAEGVLQPLTRRPAQTGPMPDRLPDLDPRSASTLAAEPNGCDAPVSPTRSGRPRRACRPDGLAADPGRCRPVPRSARAGGPASTLGEVGAAVAAGDLCVTPAVRNCIYVVPRIQRSAALAEAAEKSRRGRGPRNRDAAGI